MTAASINPEISVLVATYNQAAFLRQALDSLAAQTLSRAAFEVIIINDGSTDTTSETLDDYRSWMRIVERENRGLVPTCNEGIDLATGEYFARLDSDDFVAPEWLEVLSEYLTRTPDACCAFPDRYELADGRLSLVRADHTNMYSLEACGVLFRKEALADIGGYRPFYWEEYDLYLRLRRAGSFLHVPRPLYTYRKHPAAMTRDKPRRIKGWIQLASAWGCDTLRAAGSHPDLEEALRTVEDERQECHEKR